MAISVNSIMVGTTSSLVLSTVPTAGTTVYSSWQNACLIIGSPDRNLTCSTPTFVQFCNGGTTSANPINNDASMCQLDWRVVKTGSTTYTIEYESSGGSGPAYSAPLSGIVKSVLRTESDLIASKTTTGFGGIDFDVAQIYSFQQKTQSTIYARFDCLIQEFDLSNVQTDYCYLSIFQQVSEGNYKGYETSSYDIKTLGYV
jgi:hypothetical protein